jgi:prepilin-type N-terminal cleavage/methylation domain-containing protein
VQLIVETIKVVTYNSDVQSPQRGFTLSEIIAVIVVLVILAAIVVARVGDLRSTAYLANSARLEKEFSQGVEDLVANGDNINPAIQGIVAAGGAPCDGVLSNPLYMGLATTNWHVSTVLTPNSTLLLQVFSKLNDNLNAMHCGAVRVPDSQEFGKLLLRINADVVACYSGSNLQTVVLKFSKP